MRVVREPPVVGKVGGLDHGMVGRVGGTGWVDRYGRGLIRVVLVVGWWVRWVCAVLRVSKKEYYRRRPRCGLRVEKIDFSQFLRVS